MRNKFEPLRRSNCTVLGDMLDVFADRHANSLNPGQLQARRFAGFIPELQGKPGLDSSGDVLGLLLAKVKVLPPIGSLLDNTLEKDSPLPFAARSRTYLVENKTLTVTYGHAWGQDWQAPCLSSRRVLVWKPDHSARP